MTQVFLSSGDVLADRRAEYARGLAEGGDVAAAAELMQQALERVPDWTAGWDLLGTYHDKAGDVAGAIAAWRHLEALDAEGMFGAQLKLAAHGAGAAGSGTAVSYVEALFDQYAPRFEAALVDGLGYQVPDLLHRMVRDELERSGRERVGHALDLGCGTGLMGVRLRPVVDRLDGVDLSAAMIAETARKGIYDGLAKDELVHHLRAGHEAVDLITAADVLIYCGALEPILQAAGPRLKPGGLLAFSLEAHDGPEPLFLRPSLRFAHSPHAAQAALVAAGFDILRFEQATLRQDRGAPINGLLALARRAG